MLNVINLKINQEAQRFLRESASLFSSAEGPIAGECIDDAANVLQRILGTDKKYRSTAAFTEEYRRFLEFRGDTDAEVGERILQGQIGRDARKKAESMGFTEIWAPESVMKKIVGPDISYAALERRVIAHGSREEFKQDLAGKYASPQRNPKIDVSWIEGKISGLLYCLIGDSFRRALAEEWKKKYYAG